MSTIRIRYAKQIEDLQSAISFYDQKFMETKDPNFAKFRDDNIKQLVELKEFILQQEQQLEFKF